MSEKTQAKGSRSSSSKGSDNIDSWPIEKCFEELEGIVSALESQATSLEDSLKLFERGMKLSQRCSRELSSIEKRITVIVEGAKV